MKSVSIALVTLFFSLSASANCLVSYAQPQYRANSVTIVNQGTYLKIVDLLKAKGYTVIDPNQVKDVVADFKLRANGYWGYVCGNSLTWKDYLTVPANYTIEFSVNQGNIIFEKRDNLKRSVVLGVKSKARKELLNSLNELPHCQ